jgi:hypothetical protein
MHLDSVVLHTAGATAVIIGLSYVVGQLFKRIKQPEVIGQLFAGIALGPRAAGLGAALAQLEQSQVSFNYLGWFDDAGDDHLFGPPMRVPGHLQDAGSPRRYLLEIVISGTHGNIYIDFIFAAEFFLERTVRILAESYRSILEEIALDLAE